MYEGRAGSAWTDGSSRRPVVTQRWQPRVELSIRGRRSARGLGGGLNVRHHQVHGRRLRARVGLAFERLEGRKAVLCVEFDGPRLRVDDYRTAANLVCHLRCELQHEAEELPSRPPWTAPNCRRPSAQARTLASGEATRIQDSRERPGRGTSPRSLFSDDPADGLEPAVGSTLRDDHRSQSLGLEAESSLEVEELHRDLRPGDVLRDYIVERKPHRRGEGRKEVGLDDGAVGAVGVVEEENRAGRGRGNLSARRAGSLFAPHGAQRRKEEGRTAGSSRFHRTRTRTVTVVDRSAADPPPIGPRTRSNLRTIFRSLASCFGTRTATLISVSRTKPLGRHPRLFHGPTSSIVASGDSESTRVVSSAAGSFARNSVTWKVRRRSVSSGVPGSTAQIKGARAT